MSTQIIYKNISGEIIPKQQAIELNRYKECTIINGLYKTIVTHYFQNHIKIYNSIGEYIGKDFSKSEKTQVIEYFLDENESKLDIKNQLFNNDVITDVLIYSNKQVSNGFVSYDNEGYHFSNKDNVNWKGKTVYDSQLNILADFIYDINTNVLKFPIKKYFKKNYQGFELDLEFKYGDDIDRAEGFYIELRNKDYDDIWPDGGYYVEDLIDDFPNFFIDFPYYSSYLPVLPTAPFI